MRQLKIAQSITNRDTDSIDKYLTDIGRIDLLSIDEELSLAKRIKKGDTVALDKLVKTNLRFVVSVAKKYQNRGLQLADLISEGNLGLIKAAHRFDDTKGFKFISFAVWWIRQTIILAISEQTRMIRLPLNMINSISTINKASSLLEQRLERLPTPEEIAAEISLTELKVNDHLSFAAKTICLDTAINNDTETTLLRTIPANYAAPDLQLNCSDEIYEVADMLRKVSPRECLVLQLHFGLSGKIPMSLEEIGRQFNVSKERVRQIRDQGIKKLRERIHHRTY